MNIGVIGTGNMGSMLARSFSSYRDLNVRIINRTFSKAKELQEEIPTLEIASCLSDITGWSDILFVCTKCTDGIEIFEKIGKKLDSTQIVVTTISSLPLEKLERLTNAKIATVIPSITQMMNSGVLLVSYGHRVDDEFQEKLDSLLRRIAVTFNVREDQMRVASDLCSCGPAFLSVLLSKWAEGSAGTGKVSYGEAEFLLSQMVVGLADLLKEGLTLSDIIQKVAVPGGVTEAGIESLNRNTKDLFLQLHKATSTHKHPASVINVTTA